MIDVQKAQTAWPALAPMLFVPHTAGEYEQLVAFLDKPTDTVGEDESHPLAALMEVVAVLVEKYEDENVSEIA